MLADSKRTHGIPLERLAEPSATLRSAVSKSASCLGMSATDRRMSPGRNPSYTGSCRHHFRLITGQAKPYHSKQFIQRRFLTTATLYDLAQSRRSCVVAASRFA